MNQMACPLVGFPVQLRVSQRARLADERDLIRRLPDLLLKSMKQRISMAIKHDVLAR